MSDREYPTKEELERIAHWPIGKYRELAQYVMGLWWHPEAATMHERSDGSFTLRLATVGWSGNESIIGALDRNMFGYACWYLSKRGGLHVYRVAANMADVEPKEDSDGCIRPYKKEDHE